MYKLCKFVENIFKFVRIKFKIFYWKIKYGKRIKIGKNFKFRKGMIINIAEHGYLEIGDNNFFNNNCSINCHKKIVIGNENLFGENVKMYDHNHVFNDKSIDMRKTYKNGEIFIGNNNWIASDVIMLSKSNIGNRNVIAAKTLINQKYESETLIKGEKAITVEKIEYK